MSATVERGRFCEHEKPHWRLAVNENGWHCDDCGAPMPGEPNGFRPDLDVSHIEEKVSSILFWLTESEVIYMSNAAEGEITTGMVTAILQEKGIYDQYSIALHIMQQATPSHAKYWKRIGDGVRKGKDPRERCECGKLANCSKGSKWYCSEHDPMFAEITI